MQLLSSGNKDLNEIALDLGSDLPLGTSLRGSVLRVLLPLGLLASLVRVLGNGRNIRRWRGFFQFPYILAEGETLPLLREGPERYHALPCS